MSLELFILLLNGIDFLKDLFYLILINGDSLFTLFSNFLNLLFKRFKLILIHFWIFFTKGDLHLFFDFKHLNLFDHSCKFVDLLLFFLKVEGLLCNFNFTCFYFLHNRYFLIGLGFNFHVFFVYLGLGNQ